VPSFEKAWEIQYQTDNVMDIDDPDVVALPDAGSDGLTDEKSFVQHCHTLLVFTIEKVFCKRLKMYTSHFLGLQSNIQLKAWEEMPNF
jgi:hypothetical protein